MKNCIWFMGGLSSQRDILLAIKEAKIDDLTVLASHPQNRPEILSVADYSFVEPEESALLVFMANIIERYEVGTVHVGRNCSWFEQHRPEIEEMGVRLVTGARDVATFALADDKVKFATFMEQSGLPVVPSLQINTVDELKAAIADKPFGDVPMCIKPVTGIYGQGFWRLDPNATMMKALADPDSRRINPNLYLQAMQGTEIKPQVLMPYLAGPECSVDMLLEHGEVIAAIGRKKEGALQHMEIESPAFNLAQACAMKMRADGLINVQTRNNQFGEPLLLEINLRPSGGICYSHACGVSLPVLFAKRQTGQLTKGHAKNSAVRSFRRATVRVVSDVIHLPE